MELNSIFKSMLAWNKNVVFFSCLKTEKVEKMNFYNSKHKLREEGTRERKREACWAVLIKEQEEFKTSLQIKETL